MTDYEDRIRTLAHRLWIEDGRPDGLEADHWFKASDIVRREIFEETMASPDPNPAMEAEDYCGIVNADPAARNGEVAIQETGIQETGSEDRPFAWAQQSKAMVGRDSAETDKSVRRRAGGPLPPTRPARRSAVPGWYGLLS